jgi:Tat protein translocase TatB subunit
MPSIGPLEIMVCALVALIVFGPDKLPDIARTVGRTIQELRRQAEDVKNEFSRGLHDDPFAEPGDAPSEDKPATVSQLPAGGSEAEPAAEPTERTVDDA